MNARQHPAWCSIPDCQATLGGGSHESAHRRIARRRGCTPRMLVHLVAPADARYTNVRIVIVDEAVTVTELDLDGADLLASTLRQLTQLAAPVDPPPPHEGFTVGTRHAR
jgi:hypothetical protein